MDNTRDYGQDTELAKQFLRDFSEPDPETGELVPKYHESLTKLANREMTLMHIELADVEKFNQDLARRIETNTKRYVSIFYTALDEILPSYKTTEPSFKDPMDVFIEQRLMVAERNQRMQQSNHPGASAATAGSVGSQQAGPNRVSNIEGQYPPDLVRRAEIAFKPASLSITPIREVKASSIGHLVTIRGIVTRVTDVKPKLTIATYTCEQCGCETFQPLDGLDFTPLSECTSSVCVANKTLGRVTLQTRGSKFVKFQDVKVQEHSDQVPVGHIPRTINVLLHGELTRQCAPGDHISVSGLFLTIESSGYSMRTGGLSVDTYIDAHYVTLINKTEDDELDDDAMSTQEAQELFSQGGDFLSRLSSSLAPEIFGHTELKKALLLLLVGGVDKISNGMKIRGNINICLMGDPGVAKSQMLSFIDRIASRSQYTTGRGSSGVGLTAAVLKDQVTGELVLEGGALVLADQGICCIDEFDKMMEADRTAIHEVMEQQTVSIAKAGIMTTLNARVSILAAANPTYGRYDQDRTISDNLNLPPALLSRFDLLWLIRDQPRKDKDLDLAQHVTHIHAFPNDEPPCEYHTFDTKQIRRYIKLCKQKNPIVPEHLTDALKKVYLDIRIRKRQADRFSREGSLFTSPRCLLAIIRLSTALARLRLADSVDLADIEAAVELYNNSRSSIEKDFKTANTSSNLIMEIVKSLCKENDLRQATLDEIVNATEKAYGHLSRDDVITALKQLHDMEVIDYRSNLVCLP